MDADTGRIRVGIGGWVFPAWRGAFYPPGLPQARELGHASRALTSIEINGTYHRTQTPESFARWHAETPDDFVFALKGPRYTTNRRILAEAGESVGRFLASGLTELGDKLGPINWQFMETKAFDPDDFAAFLDLLPASLEGRPLRHALEVRHASFQHPDFHALVRARGIAVILAGDSRHPVIVEPAASFAYIRIMGTKATEARGYPDATLDAWIARARALAAGAVPEDLPDPDAPPPGPPREVFLYVIGGAKAHNPAAATALIDRLG